MPESALAALAGLVPASVFPEGPGPYLALMLAGFFVGVLGHVVRSRWMVAIGIAMVFLATVALPLANLASQDTPPEPPGVDFN